MGTLNCMNCGHPLDISDLLDDLKKAAPEAFYKSAAICGRCFCIHVIEPDRPPRLPTFAEKELLLHIIKAYEKTEAENKKLVTPNLN